MTTLTQQLPLLSRFRPSATTNIDPFIRAATVIVGGAMTAVCLFAIGRALLGFAPELPHLRNVAVTLHVITVLPCVPLGMWLLLNRKGTPMHKQLGKLWVLLMVITATTTLFIRDGMEMSWIHIFVPLTYRAVWALVSSARKGDMRKHKNEIYGLFFGSLMIPGVWAFLGDYRLMGVMLYG